MMEPWFSPMWSFLPGTLLGVIVGCWGAAFGVLAPRGKAKLVLMGCYLGLVFCSVLALVVGIVALCVGQPYHVWYALFLAGLIVSLVLGFNYWTVKQVYQQAEFRKLDAHDL